MTSHHLPVARHLPGSSKARIRNVTRAHSSLSTSIGASGSTWREAICTFRTKCRSVRRSRCVAAREVSARHALRCQAGLHKPRRTPVLAQRGRPGGAKDFLCLSQVWKRSSHVVSVVSILSFPSVSPSRGANSRRGCLCVGKRDAHGGVSLLAHGIFRHK